MRRPGRTVAAGLAFAVLAGCAHVEVDRRVERGPTLRTFERELAAEGGLAGEVEAKWPQMAVWVSAYDLCRVHKVEEYIEERITERSASSAGPSLALGVTSTLVGAGLFLARPAFSDDPSSRVIDRGGHYGPSTRQLATGWAIGLVIVGVPALVVGVLGYSQAGEEVETRKAEQVLSATEQRCHPRPVNGTVELSDSRGPKGPARETTGGRRCSPPRSCAATPPTGCSSTAAPSSWSPPAPRPSRPSGPARGCSLWARSRRSRSMPWCSSSPRRGCAGPSREVRAPRR
ncbi:MAG: hypothetical protein ACYC8T_05035 [Myxococcaceae bacterium]